MRPDPALTALDPRPAPRRPTQAEIKLKFAIAEAAIAWFGNEPAATCATLEKTVSIYRIWVARGRPARF